MTLRNARSGRSSLVAKGHQPRWVMIACKMKKRISNRIQRRMLRSSQGARHRTRRELPPPKATRGEPQIKRESLSRWWLAHTTGMRNLLYSSKTSNELIINIWRLWCLSNRRLRSSRARTPTIRIQGNSKSWLINNNEGARPYRMPSVPPARTRGLLPNDRVWSWVRTASKTRLISKLRFRRHPMPFLQMRPHPSPFSSKPQSMKMSTVFCIIGCRNRPRKRGQASILIHGFQPSACSNHKTLFINKSMPTSTASTSSWSCLLGTS